MPIVPSNQGSFQPLTDLDIDDYDFGDEIENDKLMQDILKEALKRLKEKGRFSKPEVCVECGYGKYMTQVNWKYVKRALSEAVKQKLVAMVAEFFLPYVMERDPKNPGKLRRKIDQTTGNYLTTLADARRNPRKYVAGIGHAKRTAGYVLSSYENGIFTEQKMGQGNKIENGTNISVSDYGKSLLANGLPSPIIDPRTQLPYGQDAPALDDYDDFFHKDGVKYTFEEWVDKYGYGDDHCDDDGFFAEPPPS